MTLTQTCGPVTPHTGAADTAGAVTAGAASSVREKAPTGPRLPAVACLASCISSPLPGAPRRDPVPASCQRYLGQSPIGKGKGCRVHEARVEAATSFVRRAGKAQATPAP